MASETLIVRREEGRIAVVCLNRPDRRNALNTELRDAISASLAELRADDSISAVVVAAKGPVFCAGFDLKEFEATSMQEVLSGESATRYHETLRSFAKPLVAAVQGAAMAGGFDLAAFCDVRIAGPGAAFGHPEIKFGSGVMFGPLAAIAGGATAADLTLTGRTIDANEAHRLGIVSRVVATEALLDEARATARSIAEAPLPALVRMKEAIIARRGN